MLAATSGEEHRTAPLPAGREGHPTDVDFPDKTQLSSFGRPMFVARRVGAPEPSRGEFCWTSLKYWRECPTIQLNVLRLNLNCERSFAMVYHLPINALRRGEVASISQVVGPPEHVRRLEELGLRSGSRIEIVRGGSPCIIRVDGSTLCFRNDESVRVLVSPRMTA
jgi:ferrous iron transport protein A